jgi:hypothetical protein
MQYGDPNASNALVVEANKTAASGYVEETAKETGPKALNFAGSDLVDIGCMVRGNSVPEKVVVRGGLVADGQALCANNKSADLWGLVAGAALQKVLSAFSAMPECAFSRAADGVSFGIEKVLKTNMRKNSPSFMAEVIDA